MLIHTNVNAILQTTVTGQSASKASDKESKLDSRITDVSKLTAELDTKKVESLMLSTILNAPDFSSSQNKVPAKMSWMRSNPVVFMNRTNKTREV